MGCDVRSELRAFEEYELVGLRMSIEQLSKAMRAVIRTGTQVVDAQEIDAEYKPRARGHNEARIRLYVPVGQRMVFEKIAGRRLAKVRN